LKLIVIFGQLLEKQVLQLFSLSFFKNFSIKKIWIPFNLVLNFKNPILSKLVKLENPEMRQFCIALVLSVKLIRKKMCLLKASQA
jgi:hypothetical protein